ncbi:MAG: c-type cytochrome [Rhodothermales bacterium]|nr:c-type cytochrome [Rhodothermales bacterium]
MVNGASKITSTYEVTGVLEEVAADSAALALGKHLSEINACRDCHGASFEGRVFADAPPFLMVAPNLTSGEGGVGGRYGVEDWDRAIRYGVRPDGTSLLIMPARTFHNLTDTDAASLIAYLQSLPPVDNVLPPREIRPLGRVLLGSGAMDVAMEVHTSPDRAPAHHPVRRLNTATTSVPSPVSIAIRTI